MATYNGTSGADNYTGSTDNDTIVGGDGNDTLNGLSGNDLILGNMADDLITGGDGFNTVLGGMGNDAITVGNGNNLLYGNEGSDTITAGNGNNTVIGGQDSTDGADLIRTGSGADLIISNGGNDTVASGAGDDSIVAGFGNDIVLGNQGNDLLLGNQGDDTLWGGQGQNTLVGGMGNDLLYSTGQNDLIIGSEGDDTVRFNSSASNTLLIKNNDGSVTVENSDGTILGQVDATTEHIQLGTVNSDGSYNLDSTTDTSTVGQTSGGGGGGGGSPPPPPPPVPTATYSSGALNPAYANNKGPAGSESYFFGDGTSPAGHDVQDVKADKTDIELFGSVQPRQELSDLAYKPSTVTTSGVTTTASYTLPTGPESTTNGSQANVANREATNLDFGFGSSDLAAFLTGGGSVTLNLTNDEGESFSGHLAQETADPTKFDIVNNVDGKPGITDNAGNAMTAQNSEQVSVFFGGHIPVNGDSAAVSLAAFDATGTKVAGLDFDLHYADPVVAPPLVVKNNQGIPV